MADFVRRDIWALEEEAGTWHPLTEAYALAVGVMQGRDDDDPTGWVHQAAVHGMNVAQPPDEFRHQCQHNTWYFLPWHRMYLHFFERIVRAAVREHPDVPDDVRESWALPFWDYDRGGDTATLPTAFREPTLADGTTPNPLFTELRNGNLMLGGPLDPRLTSAARALAEGFFSNDPVPGVTVGFGGAITGWNHFDENAEAAPGELEGTPHNVIHGAVGATPGGLMRRVDTAALDPIFWLHHANIDRLWGEWLKLDGRANPQESDWLEEPFRFRDENGGSVRITSADVVSTEELGYEYEEVERPGLLADEGRPAMPTEPPPDRPPELVGATDAPLTLTGGEERVAISVSESARPALLAGEGEEAQRVYVNVEGIQGEENPGVSYAVYVNLPDDADPSTAERHHVGNISFFGIELARDVGGDPRGGHGLRYAFDITDLVRQLREQGRWDPTEVRITFAPLRPLPPPGAEAAPEPEEELPAVSIGRVGIYYQ